MFNLLRHAELYCEKHGLDVNDDIHSENPEVLRQAKEICHNVLPVLYDIREQILNTAEAYRKKIERHSESKIKHDLLQELKNEEVYRTLGVIKGIGEIRGIIEKQIEAHREIKNLNL